MTARPTKDTLPKVQSLSSDADLDSPKREYTPKCVPELRPPYGGLFNFKHKFCAELLPVVAMGQRPNFLDANRNLRLPEQFA